jgi:hypothetical protein
MKQLITQHVTPHLLRVGLAVAIGLAIPTVAVLAKGPDASNKGQGIAAQHRPADAGKPTDAGKPDNTGKPDDSGKPENAGDRPHNHGWFVSQVAKSDATTGQAHGDAVSTEAQSDDGK